MFEAFLSNRTVSVLAEALPRILTAGLTMTIPLTLVSFFFAMIIAVAVALVQYANVPVLRQIARFYIWVIRGTPLLVQLFIIFYGLPSVGIMLDAFPAAVIAFAFNEGAYCAETMRGALESVPQGQLEAGYCVGMSWWQIMRRIVLPQALRTAVPALSNSLIGMIKDTSLASNITVAELFMAGQRVADIARPDNSDFLTVVQPHFLSDFAVRFVDEVTEAVMPVDAELAQIPPHLRGGDAELFGKFPRGNLGFIMQGKLPQVTQVFR